MTIPTEPLPPLVTTEDPDYALFKAGDEEYLLRVASSAIREYCGWHIAPSITEVCRQLKIGSKGIVPLPSRHVTDVSQVTVHTHDPLVTPLTSVVYHQPAVNPTVVFHDAAHPLNTYPGPWVIPAEEYEWFEDGWMQHIGYDTGWGWGWPGSYFYGPEVPYRFPTDHVIMLDVEMTHGYETLPENLKQIAFELAQGAATTGGLISGVKTIQSPQYSATFTDQVKAGMTFTPDHKSTLANYRLGWFA